MPPRLTHEQISQIWNGVVQAGILIAIAGLYLYLIWKSVSRAVWFAEVLISGGVFVVLIGAIGGWRHHGKKKEG